MHCRDCGLLLGDTSISSCPACGGTLVGDSAAPARKPAAARIPAVRSAGVAGSPKPGRMPAESTSRRAYDLARTADLRTSPPPSDPSPIPVSASPSPAVIRFSLFLRVALLSVGVFLEKRLNWYQLGSEHGILGFPPMLYANALACYVMLRIPLARQLGVGPGSPIAIVLSVLGCLAISASWHYILFR